MENNRIAIDTNVFISALIGQYSYPYKIFDELVLTGEIILCMSVQLWREYESVSQRDKFQKVPGFTEKAKKLLVTLKEVAVFVETTTQITLIKDEPDNRLLELAVAAQSSVIVTGNSRDFTFDEYEGVKIQNPKDFYEGFMERRYQ